MQKVWIVYRGDVETEILGVFNDQGAATRYAQTLAETAYEGERIWTGGYAIPYRITDDVPQWWRWAGPTDRPICSAP